MRKKDLLDAKGMEQIAEKTRERIQSRKSSLALAELKLQVELCPAGVRFGSIGSMRARRYIRAGGRKRRLI